MKTTTKKRLKQTIKDGAKAILGAVVFFALFALAGVCVFGADRAQNDGDVYGACCRVLNQTRSCSGSGTCFYQDRNGACYILTNYHVANNNDCLATFFWTGEPVQVKASNVWRSYDESKSIDIAILKIEPKDAGAVKTYVPILNGVENPAETGVVMTSAGCPKGLWLRSVKGKLKPGGSGNYVFQPAPFGGQSGSSIIIDYKGRPYIGALLTWRSTEEGAETFGGIAQGASKVLTAMTGQTTTIVTGNGCPPGCVTVPYYDGDPRDVGEPQGGKKIETPDGVFIECSKAEKKTVEVWTIYGCQPCQLLKANYAPGWSKYANVTYRDGNADRINAIAFGISQYPTTRVLDQYGKEIYRGVGYSADVNKSVLEKIKQPNSPIEVATCGPFNLFGDLPKSDDENGDVPDQPAEPQPDQPENGLLSPKTTPRNDDDNAGGLFTRPGLLDGLEGRIEGIIKTTIEPYITALADAVDGAIDRLLKGVFWLCFFACLLALLCYKTVVGIIKSVWACIKWGASKTRVYLKQLSNNLLSAIASRLNEKTKEVKKEKGDK